MSGMTSTSTECRGVLTTLQCKNLSVEPGFGEVEQLGLENATVTSAVCCPSKKMTAGKTAPNQATAGQTAPNQGQVRHISDPALYFNDHRSMQAVCICETWEKDQLLLDFFTNVEIDSRSFVSVMVL